MKKGVICSALLVVVALLAWAAGPNIQAGSLLLNNTYLLGTSGGVMTLPNATDTVVGKATTDVFTHKTFNTAGAGNVFQINGTTVNAVNGSGSTALLSTAPSLSGSPAVGDNSTKVATTNYVQAQGYMSEYFTPVFARTCAPAGCATFGASPQTVSPAGLTIQAADMTVNSVFEFNVHFAGAENTCGGSCSSSISMLLGGVSIGCNAATGGSTGGSGATAGYHGIIKIVTTGVGGTAKAQCSGAVFSGSGVAAGNNGVPLTNVSDATFSLNTTASRSFTFESDNDTTTTRAIFYDMEMKKIQ